MRFYKPFNPLFATELKEKQLFKSYLDFRFLGPAKNKTNNSRIPKAK